MIGRIQGQLVEAGDQVALVDVGGVAYEVEVAAGVRAALPPAGGQVTLHTHFLVRDDAQQLYGFASRMERDLFRALMRIPSVGPKLAMAVISTFDLDELAGAAAQGDAAYLTRVPGVGRKTAERMLIDLQDRLSEFDLQPNRAAGRVGGAAEEAERALVALGYRAGEAARLIAEAGGEAASAAEIVREALRRAGKGS